MNNKKVFLITTVISAFIVCASIENEIKFTFIDILAYIITTFIFSGIIFIIIKIIYSYFHVKPVKPVNQPPREYITVNLKNSNNNELDKETELLLASLKNQYTENDYRIYRDSLSLVKDTKKPDVFFERLDLLFKKAYSLAGARDSQIAEYFNEIINNENSLRHQAIDYFIQRYLENVTSGIDSLKTEKGKQNRFLKNYEEIKQYYNYMDNANIEKIEEFFKYSLK